MPSSLTILLPSALGFSPHPPVSVYGTGAWQTIAAFLDRRGHMLHYFSSLHITARTFVCGFASTPSPLLVPVFPFLAHAFLLRPHSSDHMWYRNLNLLSIGYASRPLLRSRLTQGRSALPWNPWIFGRKDSHLPLATHSGILSSYPSTAPYRYSFVGLKNAPLPIILGMIPQLRCCVSAPDIFGAGTLD